MPRAAHLEQQREHCQGAVLAQGCLLSPVPCEGQQHDAEGKGSQRLPVELQLAASAHDILGQSSRSAQRGHESEEVHNMYTSISASLPLGTSLSAPAITMTPGHDLLT